MTTHSSDNLGTEPVLLWQPSHYFDTRDEAIRINVDNVRARDLEAIACVREELRPLKALGFSFTGDSIAILYRYRTIGDADVRYDLSIALHAVRRKVHLCYYLDTPDFGNVTDALLTTRSYRKPGFITSTEEPIAAGQGRNSRANARARQILTDAEEIREYFDRIEIPFRSNMWVRGKHVTVATMHFQPASLMA